jgi:membrane protease YdiL (CAAX protease family)
MIGVLLASYQLPYDPNDPFQEHIHPIAFPGVYGITNLFTHLRPDDRAAWEQPINKEQLAELLKGFGYGSAAILSVLAFAAARGWVSAPHWGWQGTDHSPATVIASATLRAAQTAMLVYNEETIFRGYGFDQLRKALGTPGAVVVSSALFARYHGPGWNRFFGLGVAGLLLSLLRLNTNSLWFAAGFHFAWNLMQTSVFGPHESAPSLRPLHLHGPTRWVGRLTTLSQACYKHWQRRGWRWWRG